MDPRRAAANLAQQEIANDAIDTLKKGVSTFLDFMTSDNNDEFVKDFDAKNGTNIGGTLANARQGAQRVASTVASSLATQVPSTPVHGEVGPLTRDILAATEQSGARVVLRADAAGGAVVEACGLCSGKAVVKEFGGQKYHVACPACGKGPL